MNTPWPDVPALLLPALGETLIMVGIVMVFVVALGTPLGVWIFNTSPHGLAPNQAVHTTLSAITNIGRSLPFLVLMAAIIPFTRFLVGSNIGIKAAVVPMVLAGIPFFARIVENAIRSVPPETNAAGLAAGGSSLQVVRSAQLGEALPSLVGGLTLSLIAMIEYSAIAGAIGAGGLGYLAVNYGYQRFDGTIMIACVVALVLLTQIIQFTGDKLAARLTH